MRVQKWLLLTSFFALTQPSNADIGWARLPNPHYVPKVKHELDSFFHKKNRKRSDKIVVAVIDTGIADDLKDKDFLCKTGHFDFITGTPNVIDRHSHGTHISGTIDQYVKNFLFIENKGHVNDIDKIKANYCQVIFKYFDPKYPNTDTVKNTVAAIRAAIALKVDFINYSGGGLEFSKAEHNAVKDALDAGIIFVAAAGNERSKVATIKEIREYYDLQTQVENKAPSHKLWSRFSKMQRPTGYFPAMYDSRTVIVGNLVRYGDRLEAASSSNVGVDIRNWEIGTNVLSRIPNGFGYLSGTSQAAAIKTGKLIRQILMQQVVPTWDQGKIKK